MVNIVDFFLPANHTGTDVAFLLCAIAGTAFFSMKVALMLLGGSLDGDGHDVEQSPGDTELHTDGEGSAFDTFDALKILSINSVAAFFAMFGWAGLSAHLQFQFGTVGSSLVALVCGSISMFLVAYLFLLLKKLSSAGASFNIQELVGQEAEVYERIPSNGRGKIQVTVNGMLREFEAESVSDATIDSFSTVRITAVRGGNLLVEKA